MAVIGSREAYLEALRSLGERCTAPIEDQRAGAIFRSTHARLDEAEDTICADVRAIAAYVEYLEVQLQALRGELGKIEVPIPSAEERDDIHRDTMKAILEDEIEEWMDPTAPQPIDVRRWEPIIVDADLDMEEVEKADRAANDEDAALRASLGKVILEQVRNSGRNQLAYYIDHRSKQMEGRLTEEDPGGPSEPGCAPCAAAAAKIEGAIEGTKLSSEDRDQLLVLARERAAVSFSKDGKDASIGPSDYEALDKLLGRASTEKEREFFVHVFDGELEDARRVSDIDEDDDEDDE